MKKSIVIILACGLILIGGLTASAAVVPPAEATGVFGQGWFISDMQPTEGNSCHFVARALGGLVADGPWLGRGQFWDKDCSLRAKLHINREPIPIYSRLLPPKVVGKLLGGEAEVWIKGEFRGTYEFGLALIDGGVHVERPKDEVELAIQLDSEYYHAHGTLTRGSIEFFRP